jgi:DNA-binding winged helix-turn-helix (wHTH) protein
LVTLLAGNVTSEVVACCKVETSMRVSFSPYVLDPERRQLLRGDTIVHLSPKAFDLLTILVAQRPKAVSKSDLLDRLWPGTFVVEKNLANLISEIRDAIGDDPSNPRFIRTVHRFGYAFDGAPDRAGSATRSRHGGETSFRLKWIDGRVTLGEGVHVIGRDPDAAIFLNVPGVSRRHALLTIAEGVASIEDLGSKNGTFVGAQRVNGSIPIGDGDIVGVGSVKLTLTRLQTPSSTETEQDQAGR